MNTLTSFLTSCYFLFFWFSHSRLHFISFHTVKSSILLCGRDFIAIFLPYPAHLRGQYTVTFMNQCPKSLLMNEAVRISAVSPKIQPHKNDKLHSSVLKGTFLNHLTASWLLVPGVCMFHCHVIA